MNNTFFIGVDGGATKCTVRVENAIGELLGQATTGPANIRLSIEQSWQSIHAGLTMILAPHGVTLDDNHKQFHAVMGLAGTEAQAAYEQFLQTPHPFHSLTLVSDAHTACMGAHAGEDGAIVVIGTGVVGYQIVAGVTTKVGGLGFPHDDEGGGAWLGFEAFKLYLKSLDGRAPASEFTQAIGDVMANINAVEWANHANATAYATLAPVVIKLQQQGNVIAIELMQQAATAVAKLIRVLQAANKRSLPIALIGGVAPFLSPYLSLQLQMNFAPCQLSPDAGAILMMRNRLVLPKIK